MKNKYDVELIKELAKIEEKSGDIARAYAKKMGLEYSESLRKGVSKVLHKRLNWSSSTTESNDYFGSTVERPKIMSAFREDNSVMNIEEYCAHYNLDFSKVRSYKLVSHTGTPYYNIVFYTNDEEQQKTFEEIKAILEKEINSLHRPVKASFKTPKEGVVKLADLHIGALVSGLLRTKDYSSDILISMLNEAAAIVNSYGFKKVHVHILGDLIESFTGLNHINSWRSMDVTATGSNVIKMAVDLLDIHFLSLIYNLGDVKIIAGNHDRTSSNNKEDVFGGAADLISWGLSLKGYNCEFNSIVISHEVDGINHILLHGHHEISKKSTQQICWDYGKQGMFNLVNEAHLHSIIEKLSENSKKNFKTTRDDSVDHRRFHCPSFFSGNFFSESLGYYSQGGFVIVSNNGKGVPNVHYYAV